MNARQVSGMTQFWILTARQLFILKSNIKKLLMISLLPIVTGFIVGAVSGDAVFVTYENTKSSLFAIVSVAIWIGLFNSIQEICQERSILKREYMANLKLTSYIFSKFFVQAILCFLQSNVFLLVCMIFIRFPGPENPFSSVFFLNMFITVYLIMLAADAMGLFISSLVKSGDIANIIAPIILIIQLVLSGVLFDLSGFGKFLSYLTFSKWGMDCLGALGNMNSLEINSLHYASEMNRFQLRDVLSTPFNPDFEPNGWNLWKGWLMLMIFCVGLVFLSALLLRRVAKDSR